MFTINGNLKIWENIGGAFNIALDPYALDSLGKRSDKFQWTEKKQLLRFQTGNISLNATFQGKVKQFLKIRIKDSRRAIMFLMILDQYYDFNNPGVLRLLIPLRFHLRKQPICVIPSFQNTITLYRWRCKPYSEMEVVEFRFRFSFETTYTNYGSCNARFALLGAELQLDRLSCGLPTIYD